MSVADTDHSASLRPSPGNADGGARSDGLDSNMVNAAGLLHLAPDACLLRHVARTSRAVVAAFDPALAPFGLTGHQFNLMMTLNQLGPLTVGQLAEKLGMDPSGVPRAVRPLGAVGHVATVRGQDRRQRVLSLTESGKFALERAVPAWTRVQHEITSALGQSRWLALIPELRAIYRIAASCSTRGGSQSAE